jgi:hypothetical protein
MRPSSRRNHKKKEGPWVKILRALGLVILAASVLAFVASSLLSKRGDSAEEPIVLKNVRVQVLNGCGLSGAAQQVANLLRLNGYDVVEVGNASAFDYPSTLILDRVGKGGRAREVAEVLGLGCVIIQRVEGSPFDATVIVGKDAKRVVRG